MKIRKLISILILVLAVLVIAGSCATGRKVAKGSQKLYGTWVNEDYNDVGWHFAKIIYNPDGTFAFYENELDTKPMIIGKSIITDSWTDSEGNIWIQEEIYIGTYFEGKNISEYFLTKISNSGRTREWVMESVEYPTEIDPNLLFYQIQYRQE